jgi:hypothetical protein
LAHEKQPECQSIEISELPPAYPRHNDRLGIEGDVSWIAQHTPQDRGYEDVVYECFDLLVSLGGLHAVQTAGFQECLEKRPLPVPDGQRVVSLGGNCIKKLCQLTGALVVDTLQGIERVLHRVENPRPRDVSHLVVYQQKAAARHVDILGKAYEKFVHLSASKRGRVERAS